MKNSTHTRKSGFTLVETVIAIGVLAVLLTGFMYVFAPAAEGIKRSIGLQEADRLVSTLEQELSVLRPGENSENVATGFDKAFRFIEDSMNEKPQLVFLYQYRGDLKKALRSDQTHEPYLAVDGQAGVPGVDYTVVTAARRILDANGKEDANLKNDLQALEGRLYAVKMKQLVFSGGSLVENNKALIEDPTPGEVFSGTAPPYSGKYPEAVIAFTADFFAMPTKNYDSVKSYSPAKLNKPMFSRNLAVRR